EPDEILSPRKTASALRGGRLGFRSRPAGSFPRFRRSVSVRVSTLGVQRMTRPENRSRPLQSFRRAPIFRGGSRCGPDGLDAPPALAFLRSRPLSPSYPERGPAGV